MDTYRVLFLLLFCCMVILSACQFRLTTPALPVASAPAPTYTVVLATDSGAGEVYTPEESPVPYRVTAEHLNVRKAPGYNWEVVGWLEKDDVVMLRDFRAGWAFTGSGWVSLRYVELIEDGE